MKKIMLSFTLCIGATVAFASTNTSLILTDVLTRVYQDETLTLDAVDDRTSVYDSKVTFSYIDDFFQNHQSVAFNAHAGRDEMDIEIYELEENANLVTMFRSITNNFHELILSQAQIVNFVSVYKSFLQKAGGATFFMFSSKYEYYVASVYMYSMDRIAIAMTYLTDPTIWLASSKHRVVVPKIQ